MPAFQTKLAELTYKYLTDRLSTEEYKDLMQRINNSPEEKKLFEEMTNQDWLITQTALLYTVDTKAELQHLIERGIFEKKTTSRWYYIRAAALVLVALGLGYLLVYNMMLSEDPKTAEERSNRNMNSLARYNGVLLTLANQDQVLLDTAMNGHLENPDSVNIEKKGDELIYSMEKGRSGPVRYHKLLTNRSKVFKVMLSDGSKVWLNAESTIDFPTRFSSNERIVDITGEAYFEIATDSLRPFKVRTRNLTVEALGTRFNINSYANEPLIKTTLLEGTVNVYVNNTKKKMVQGQQLEITAKGKIAPLHKVDVHKVIAWKDGTYHFFKQDIGTILRQVERWYDVEVTYKGFQPKTKFDGMFSRSMPIDTLIGKLEALTGLQLEIKNTINTISP